MSSFQESIIKTEELSSLVFRWTLKMSPEQLDSLVNVIQDNLKKDLILVKGFHSQSLQDHRRAKKVFALKILCLLNITRLFILSFVCLFPSSKISIDFKVIFVDTFFGFGSFGCLTNQIYLLGFTFILNFLHVMHEAEKNDQLQIISHIQDHRKFRLTPAETIKFAKYLKWIKTMRSFFIYVTLPSYLLFLAVGGCLSSLKVQSMTFTAASIFVTLVNCTQMYFSCVWVGYAFMIPVHSDNVLSILFNRLFYRIQRLKRVQSFIGGHFKLNSKTKEQVSIKLRQWVKRGKQRVKERHEILKMSENLLRQMDLHNQTVRHILDKAISCLVPVFGLAIVFFVDERGNLLLQAFSAIVGFGGLVFYVSLFKSRNIYTLSRRLSSKLHGVQVRLRGKGIKSQLQVLRLIQKTSDCESWHHSIGFTVGNRASLSPKLVLSSFIQTVTIALTFLNSKSNWRQ